MAVKNEPLILEVRMFKGEEPGLSAIGTELGVIEFDGKRFSFLSVVKGTGVSSSGFIVSMVVGFIAGFIGLALFKGNTFGGIIGFLIGSYAGRSVLSAFREKNVSNQIENPNNAVIYQIPLQSIRYIKIGKSMNWGRYITLKYANEKNNIESRSFASFDSEGFEVLSQKLKEANIPYEN